MILLKSIEFRGQSDAGPFSGIMPFSPGLQVITAPNAYGKSLAATAFAWCLGIEPIFGLFDNDPACFPLAAREEIDFEDRPSVRVVSSECTITLTDIDGRDLRLTRPIKGDRAIVRVEERSAGGHVRRSNLHARRAAMQDEHGGLQRFLFEWFRWPRENVITLKGTNTEVYLENLAPLFFVDQDEGWTDLQALQISRYGQQQISEIAVEYLLGAIDAVKARVGRQRAVLRDAGLRDSAKMNADRVNMFFLRHGWSVEWSGNGSVQDVLTRWSSRKLAEGLLQEANVDLPTRRASLETQRDLIRKALTTDPVDAANISAPATVSQKAVDLKRTRHQLNEELGTLRTQHEQIRELVFSLDHRIHAAEDLLRLKTTGVGRLEHAECPTCHRDLDPTTFALTEQSRDSVAAHIAALVRDRELMVKNLQTIGARLTTLQADTVRVEAELRDAESALLTVTAAVGSVREQLAKTAADLTSVERAIERIVEAAVELDDLQSAIDVWIAEARETQKLSETVPDLDRRRGSFVQALRQYLLALGHSAVNTTNLTAVHVNDQYIPYLETRRLRSLGSASDQSRLVAAYSLAIAAASNEVGGLHPGVVILDEPLQQNPDEKHRKLYIEFLSKQLAQKAKFQTVIFTFLRPQEITSLRNGGVKVVTPEGTHFLKLDSTSESKIEKKLPPKGTPARL